MSGGNKESYVLKQTNSLPFFYHQELKDENIFAKNLKYRMDVKSLLVK